MRANVKIAGLTFLSVFCLTSCGSGEHAVPYTKSVYTATYEQLRSPNAGEKKTSFKVSSDGTGRKCYVDDTRFQPLSNYRRIDSHTTGKEYWLDAKEKMATWTLLKNRNNWNFDEAWLKSIGWIGKLTPTGEKAANGRSCRGYTFEPRTKPDKTVLEYLFDKETGCMVSAVCKVNGKQQWVIKMTSFTKTVLPHSLFEIPEDYDIFEEPIGSDRDDANNPFENDRSEAPL